jgi:hypothetical protein
VRRLVVLGLGLTIIAVVRALSLSPQDRLWLIFVPLVVPFVVGATYVLVLTVRGLHPSEPAAAVVGLLVVGGLFLVSVGLYWALFIGGASTAVLPSVAPTILLVGVLMWFLGMVPTELADLASDRAVGGWDVKLRGLVMLLAGLIVIAASLRALLIGPLGG